MAQLLDTYSAEYETVRTGQAHEPVWLARARAQAMERFLATGFPTTRDEEWRFTSVAPIAGTRFVRPAAPAMAWTALEPFRLAGALAELVVVDGRFVPALSSMGALPRGVQVESLAAALASDPDAFERDLTRLAPFEQQAFTALNTALFTDGILIRVPAGTVLVDPLHALFISSRGGSEPAMSHPRLLVLAGAHSQATLVESYAGPAGGRSLTNAVAEVALGEQAVVEHYRLQRESLRAYHVGSLHVRLGRSASFTSHAVSLGGALVRNDVTAVLDGEGAECTLNGVYAADGDRVVDNHTAIDHAMPHCSSRELYKGVLAGRARGVFNGKIIVRPGAQKTDARQTNRALLLSADAQVHTKPQLEIFANDVRCTHGAAVGQLDEEALFYLRSRGLGRTEARALLVRAFAGEVLERMRLEAPRGVAQDELIALIQRAGEGRAG